MKPKEKYAKAFGRDMRISTKSAVKLCRVIRGKKLSASKRLLSDLVAGRRNLEGKYYSKAVKEIYDLLSSCEKNAEFLGLDNEKLFVHASAHTGTIMKRRRRKSAFGSRLKSTNIEMMLIEKGKARTEKKAAKEKAEIKKETLPEEKPQAAEKK
jgi:ribosomal protein L22